MFKKIHKLFLSDEIEMKERLFRVILLVGTVAVGAAIIQGLTLVNAWNLMLVYGIMFIAFIVAFISTFRFRNTNFAAILIGIVIIIVALPFIFFKGGGINSGAATWMCMGIFYVFLMFTGKKRTVFLILTLAVDVCCYVIAYFNYGLVEELATRFEVHFDSGFAVIVVGLTIGAIMSFQTAVYEKERKKNEAHKQELELLSKSKDTFFASMSHEIRTPINSIVGLNELILREDPSEEIQNYAKNIQNACKMLLSLVNDILDLSQLEISKMKLAEEEYRVYDMFHEVVDIMKVRMNDKKLKFLLDIDSSLPSRLQGDERRIKQILLNILSNAVKYTSEGSVTLTCKHEMLEDGRANIIISVADTGIGIRKEDLDYLFDAFMRLDINKNNRIEGTGLGLSITKHLVDLMGGTIAVDSIYTQGSLFTVKIPQVIVDDSSMGEFLSEKDSHLVSTYYSKSFEAPEARILIVDDDDLNLIITTKLLQDTKMTIDTASSAEECLRKTMRRYYNLIFMDYMMPDRDGGEVLREIRKQENGLCKDTPVVLLSANAFGDRMTEYAQMGFDGMLEKPINASKLEEETLKFIPEELIEYRRDNNMGGQTEAMVSRLLTRKRKKVYITSDSICDLPQEYKDKYDVKILDLYIQTKYGRFRDSKELDVNNLAQYLSDSESKAESFAPPIEEYEKFFAEALIEAEEVIYIALAGKVGKCYGNAIEATKGFSRVRVIDSGMISCGQGLLVLMAAKMAQDGAGADEICTEIERLKKKIDSSFIIPKVNILYQKGLTDIVTASICDTFNWRPVLGCARGSIHVFGIRAGKMENVWRKYIRYHLRNKAKIDDSIAFVVHAGLNARQQEIVLDEVRRSIKFKKVIFVAASPSNVCNAGLGSIGLGIIRK